LTIGYTLNILNSMEVHNADCGAKVG
jgi:hypothetical protein